ncbi:conserved protein of unknown function [Nitrospira japonica]|uniref:TIGR02453 family protein n=1 Tax=Nitrospira japonica TaxID=1325564 RepID=A0A1W1IAC3_9BACT|nr:DUF2461 domain-containing protein [Nitrospira japonica]SLM49942.1 conserved protein of unknown function [Nitrospira japonica]
MASVRFPDDTLAFLHELKDNNTREWFSAHVQDYQQCCVEPAKAFVIAAGRELRELIPGIHAEPSIMGSIFRMNRDARYAKETPYKTHLDFWFWEGERNQAVSGMFARVAPDFLGIGAGCHGFGKERLPMFRRAVADPRQGARLAEVARTAAEKGYVLKGKAYKRYPRDFRTDGLAAEFLLYGALYVHVDEPVRLVTRNGAMLEACVRHWRELAALHEWITEFVQYAR